MQVLLPKLLLKYEIPWYETSFLNIRNFYPKFQHHSLFPGDLPLHHRCVSTIDPCLGMAIGSGCLFQPCRRGVEPSFRGRHVIGSGHGQHQPSGGGARPPRLRSKASVTEKSGLDDFSLTSNIGKNFRLLLGRSVCFVVS